MKKFKILFASLAILTAANTYAQDQSVEEAQDEKTTVTVDDAKAIAKVYSNEMIAALKVTDESTKDAIYTLNQNYEVSLLKATSKGDKTEEEIETLKEQLEHARNKRFQGVLTAEQLKQFQIWKQARETGK